MNKSLSVKSVLLASAISVLCLSVHAQDKIRNTNDLQKVMPLKKYVETHPLPEGQTNMPVEQLKTYEKHLEQIVSSKFKLSNERHLFSNSTHLVPANDECINATLLTENNTCLTSVGDVAGATQSIPPDSCNGYLSPGANDVWFKFVAVSANPYVKVTGSAMFDAIIFLLDSCGGSILDCSEYSGNGETESIYSSGLTPGHTYYIRVYSYGSVLPTTTTFNICIYTGDPAPVHDNCSGAVLLMENTNCSPVRGSISGATQSFPSDSCGIYLSPTARDVWYKFIAVTSSPFISVAGSSSFDPALFLFGSCGGSLLDCADASGAGGLEIISASGLTPGNTYYVRVYSYGNGFPGTITFDICISTSPVPANDSMCGAISLLLNGSEENGNTAFASLAEYPSDSTVTALGYTCSIPENTVWYSYHATTTDTFYVSFTVPDIFEFYLGIFTSTNASSPCLGTLSFDSCVLVPAATGSPVTGVYSFAPAVPGATYLFMIDGVLGSVGSYSIGVNSAIPVDLPNLIRKKSMVSIFPNPSGGIVNIDFGITEKKSTIQLIDLPGKLLFEEVIENASKTQLDVSKLSGGIYFLKVENENGIITQKMILTK